MSIDVKKAFAKIQNPFMIKTTQSRNRGKLPQFDKVY